MKVRTDHVALRWMFTLNDPTGRLMRWRLRLMEFDYEIVCRPGRFHQVPIALSRLPQTEPSGSDEEFGEIDDTIPTFRTDVSEFVVGVVTRSQSQSQVDDGDQLQEPRA